MNREFKAKVVEYKGWGIFVLEGNEEVVWDFDSNGVDGILISMMDSSNIYKILDDVRNDDDEPIEFLLRRKL